MKNKSNTAILIAIIPVILAALFFVIFCFSDGNWAWLMLLLFVAPITALLCGSISILLAILALKRKEPIGRALTALCLGGLILLPAIAYAFRFLI